MTMTNPENQFQQYTPKINPDKPAPPEVLAQIVALPVGYIDFEGKKQRGVIEVNEAVADDVKAFFALALEIGFPIEKVVKSSDLEYGWDDSKLLADNATSSFNYRLIAGTDRTSLHGLGIALDVNTRTNPYIRYKDGIEIIDPPDAVYDPNAKGALTTDHPLVVLLKERGWVWGGDWTKDENHVIDYQHLQKEL
jgi:peptidoglycan L-alanyl-D-glutamate endopeptidase CwlK